MNSTPPDDTTGEDPLERSPDLVGADFGLDDLVTTPPTPSAQDRGDVLDPLTAQDLRWGMEIITLIDKIECYTARGRSDFFDEDDDRTFEAVQMRIVNLGHAVSRLSPGMLTRVGPELSLLHKMRNRVAHDYLQVDREIVWVTATRHLPALRDGVAAVLDDASGQQHRGSRSAP